MLKPARLTLVAALVCGSMSAANAADIYEPPVVEAPPVYQPVDFGGWYIRGDLGYRWSDFRGADYITYGYYPGTGTLDGDLDGGWSIGGGVGYQINRYLRTDVTLDYWGGTDFTGETSGWCGEYRCTSLDETSYDAWVLLANAYVDLGTYAGFTPYVGAGIGGTYLSWDDLRNTIYDDTTTHGGSSDWRFTYALMVGTSYCFNPNLNLDVGYRYSRIEGGDMFGYAYGAGPGTDDGISTHEVRAGLRWQFGAGNPDCGPVAVAYQPEPAPVYK